MTRLPAEPLRLDRLIRGGTIYSIELIGDHVLVTCQIDGNPIVVKAEKSFTGEIGAAIGIQAPPGRCYLFDQETGARLR